MWTDEQKALMDRVKLIAHPPGRKLALRQSGRKVEYDVQGLVRAGYATGPCKVILIRPIAGELSAWTEAMLLQAETGHVWNPQLERLVPCRTTAQTR